MSFRFKKLARENMSKLSDQIKKGGLKLLKLSLFATPPLLISVCLNRYYNQSLEIWKNDFKRKIAAQLRLDLISDEPRETPVVIDIRCKIYEKFAIELLDINEDRPGAFLVLEDASGKYKLM